MITRLIIPAILVTLLGVPSPGVAQTTDRFRWTFGATAGGGRTWDDESSIGKGWLVGGYADRRLSEHVDVELSADLLRHERNTGPFGFHADGHTTYLSAAIIRRFGPPDAQAFLLGGGTVGIHGGRAGLGDAPASNDADSTNTGFVFGGGLSFRTASSVEIAPVVRMTLMRTSTEADPWSSIMIGVRVGFAR